MAFKLVYTATSPLFLNFLRRQIGFLREEGFRICIVCSPGEQLQKFVEQEQVPGYGVEMPRRITPIKDLVALSQLCSILRRVRPHLVHANTPKGGLLGMVASYLCRVPVRIYHVHGLPFMSASGGKRRLLRWTEKISCRLAHSVLCVSHSVREVMVRERLCPPEKVRVLASGSVQGVDADERFNPDRFPDTLRHQLRANLGIPDKAVVVGYAGRIVRDKGMEELAQAWQMLQAEYPRLYLLLVGDFEPQDPVSDSARKTLTSAPRAIITGWVEDTAPYYATMDILTLPSYREGFPNAPLEAAAMGIPVIATNIPGCTDAVVDGITGTLVPPHDASALAHAIERYIRQPLLRSQHGRAGRERVLTQFRQEVIWHALLDHYRSLLEQRGLSSDDLLHGAPQ